MPIIRDNVDIDTLIDESTVDMNKTSLTDSEVVQYSTIDLRHQHLKIFSLLTTSDKEINLRMYPDEHVQNMAKNHSWIYPYAKPLNLDHVSKAASNGRFLDAWYVNHKDLTPQYGLTDCPQAVIDEFKKRGAFDGEGTGSNIGMIETTNLDCKKKIIDGTYLTTSQGAYTETLTCNICGNSYYDWGACRHARGSTYPIFSEDGKTIKEMKKCVPFTGPLDALEDSVVGTPANDTSTMLVFDTKKNRVVNMDNIAEYSDIFNVLENNSNTGTNDNLTVNTGDNKNIQEPIEDSKKAGLTQKQIEDIAKMLKEGKPVPASILSNDNKVSEIQTKNIEDNKNTQGGEMPYNRKNATAKKVFKDSVKSLGLDCADKATEYFENLTDEELDVVMSFLDFVEDNKEVIDNTNTTTKPVIDNEQVEQTITTSTVVDNGTTTETTNKIEDSEEYKVMQVELQKAKDELAKLKGIDNTIPNLSQISDNNSVKPKTKKFNF